MLVCLSVCTFVRGCGCVFVYVFLGGTWVYVFVCVSLRRLCRCASQCVCVRTLFKVNTYVLV